MFDELENKAINDQTVPTSKVHNASQIEELYLLQLRNCALDPYAHCKLAFSYSFRHQSRESREIDHFESDRPDLD
eukprot:221922-Pleurochrysis_carterae.AAC.1